MTDTTDQPPTGIHAGMTVSETLRIFDGKLAELHDLLTKIDDDQISNHLRCLGCLVEQHQGAREEVNAAATIVGGQATCLQHLQFADGPVLPGRTQSGLIVTGG